MTTDELQQIIAANRTPRYCALDRLEAFVETTQYDGRSTDWFDGSESAPPLRERRPCIAYPIVRTAIDSNVDLCLGEGKFPAIVLTDGDDAETEGESLSEDERAAVDSGITKLVELAKLKQAFRAAFASAQGARSAVLIGGMRKGKPFVEIEKAKRCTATFGEDGEVVSLTVQYVYLVDVRDREGKWSKEAKLYKRVIDTEADTTFAAVKAQPDGSEPKSWPVATVVAHGLGFCPVVWYAHMKGVTTAGEVDGRAIHEQLLDEIEGLDMVLSQWHRAAFYAGDPQGYEIGVDERGPMAQGRTLQGSPSGTVNPPSAADLSTRHGGAPSGANPVNGRWGFGPPKRARKKGPGEWWRYENPDVKVGILTLPGDALKAIQDNARDLRDKVSEGLGVVFSDPETVRFASALSGKAQQMLRQRQLDRCDQYRDDMADAMIRPVIHLLLRILAAVQPRSAALKRMVALTSKLGEEPGITLRWGAYYEPDPEEQKKLADFLVAADKVVALPARIKLAKLARSLDIENVDAVLDEIEREAEEREAKAQEAADRNAQALAKAAHGPVGAADPGRPGAKPPPNARGGSGAAAPAPATVKGG